MNAKLAQTVLDSLRTAEKKLALAESCTGGLIASLLTSIPGASNVLERGWIVYSNESKVEELGVSQKTLKQHGAVSPQTAEEMARGALAHSHADIAISVTGIAGPDGGTPEKPIGLVYFGLAAREKKEILLCEHSFSQHQRTDIQHAAAQYGLTLVLENISKENF